MCLLAENHCLIPVVLPLVLLQAEPAVTAHKPAWPRHVGRPSIRNMWMMGKMFFPGSKQSAHFPVGLVPGYEVIPMPEKDKIEELITGPGKRLPKDKLVVIGTKLCPL